MSATLKAAVVGCGGAGLANHIPWYAQNPDVALVGLVDSNCDAANKVGRWNACFYTDLATMLEREQPDLVSIASPVHLHAQHVLTCLDHGCHVLCEKPMAPSLEACQQMIDRAQEKQLVLGVAFDKRFSLIFDQARQLVQEGHIGKPHFVRAHIAMSQFWVGTDRDPGFRGKLTTGGGAFQDLGSHYLDVTGWLLDQRIISIQGHIDFCCPDKMEVEDQAVALLTFDDGVRGLLECSWVGPMDMHHGHVEELWIYGRDGAVKIAGAQRLELPHVALWNRQSKQWRLIPLPCDTGQLSHYQYKRMIDRFVTCVKGGQTFVPGGPEGKTTAGAVLGLYQSAHTGQPVKLPLEADPPLSEIFDSKR